MTTMGPAFVIDGPVPAPPPHRLLDVAHVIEESTPHWLNGGAVWPYPEAGAYSFDPCAGGSDRVKAEAGVIPLPEFGAFTVYITETCTNRSVGDFEYWKNRAMVTLHAAESYAVEREFSQGIALPGNPYLADSNAQIINGGIAVPSKAGLAFLSDAIGQSEVAGIVHATPATVSSWGEWQLRVENGRLFTMPGAEIVSGGGYINAVPDGEDPLDDGQGWAFATGFVEIRRTPGEFIPEETYEAVDRATNTITYRAESHFLVTWDTYLQAAVLVDWTT